MNEEQIRSLLRSLPRERASTDFTERVMNRLDEANQPVYLQPRFAFAASMVLVIAVWVGVNRWQSAVQEDEAADAQIRSLRTEVQQIQNDIRLLKDLAPVLYLGGNKDVDFVLDLKQLAGGEEGNGAQPISFAESGQRIKKGEHRQ